MVSAAIAAVVSPILIPTSGSAKRTKKIISSSGKLRISSTRKNITGESTGTSA
ncbi:hypothetical protein D3C71_2208510 [compost metagenome]